MSPGKCVDSPTIASVAGERTGLGDRHVVLADVAAVGAGRCDEVGPVVEDQQRAGLVAQPAGDGGCGEQLLVAGLLVAQLDDVDAAGERRGEHALQRAPTRLAVADEVQDRRVQAGAAIARVVHPAIVATDGRDRPRAHYH